MKICFNARPSFDKLSTEIFLSIKNNHMKDMEALFITNDKPESDFILSKIPNAKVREVSSFIKRNWNQYSLEKLSYYETKYNCEPIWEYIYTDRFLINQDYDYCVKMTVGLFHFFEDIYCKEKVNYYYDETIATLQTYISFLVGKFYGVKYISQMTARGLDSTHHFFLNDPYQYNMNFDKNYKNKSYNNKVKEIAENYLDEFETKNFKPENMLYTKTKPKLSLKHFFVPILWLRNRVNSKLNDKYSYMYYKGYNRTFDSIIFLIRYQLSKKYYNKPDYNIKFVYYPLHYQPEASTIVCAQKYEKQLFFIDSWAKSLPSDTVLYIKEHYAVLGHRSMSFYKELSKYPNVVLIDPLEDTFKLIKSAVAVTTLTGTAGWEAMLLRKPVFVAGNVLYDNAPGVIKIDDIYGRYVDAIKNWVKPNKDEIIQYLCEYLTTLSVGNVYSDNPTCYEGDNIFNVATSLYNQIMKLEELS